MIATSIVKTVSVLGKLILSVGFSMQTLTVAQSSVTNNESFYEALTKNAPAKLMYILSIIYLTVIVVYKAVTLILKAYKQFKLDKIEISKAHEDLERSEIDTDIKLKELNKN